MSKLSDRVFGHVQTFHQQSCQKNNDKRQQYPADFFKSWKNVDFMIQHVKDCDVAFRRMRNKQVEPMVIMAIDRLKACLVEESANDHRDSGDSDFDMSVEDSVELMDATDHNNIMNRMLSERYSAQNINASALSVSEKQQIMSGSVDDEDYNDSVADELASTKRTVVPDDERPAKKKAKSSVRSTNEYAVPNVYFRDMGGIDACVEEVRELVEAPLRHPEIFQHLNIKPPRGILLHGAPGCGKTLFAKAIAGELQLPFIQISAPSIVSGMSGESEKKLRELFDEAKRLAPCILFLDEIDVITPKRENVSKDMERRIVAQLLTLMDDLASEVMIDKPVIVIGATNRPDSLDPALRRAGRFDREISLGIPDVKARTHILKILTSDLRLCENFDLEQLAKLTPGYVGADLQALTTVAGVLAVKRIFGQLTGDEDCVVDSVISKFLKSYPEKLSDEQLNKLSITMQDFEGGIKKVQPSSKREGFATVPEITWDDIGALSNIREELRMFIVEPIKHPELFAKVGISNPSGVLLWGPPGCGKTLLAKAVASESHCNFISVKGPELLNKYVGESEKGVRQLFTRARLSAPCVIFFDELDALCPKRGNSSDNSTTERVVNQLLTEMDGLEGRKNVYIIAATNRPDIIDRAIMRPGRLDKLVHVRLPDSKERSEILKTLTSKVPLHESVDLLTIAESDKCERFSGADLSSLIREAGISALKQKLSGDWNQSLTQELKILPEHFEMAFQTVHPSVTEKDLRNYESIACSLR